MYKVLSVIAIFALLLSACSRSEETSYTQSASAPAPGTAIVKACSAEAGIPENDPKHAITPAEMEKLTKCIDRVK